MSINKPYRGPDDLPQAIPVFPLSGALLLPLGQLPLNIFEPRYMQMIDDAMRGDRIIGMVQLLSDAPGQGSVPCAASPRSTACRSIGKASTPRRAICSSTRCP